MKISAILISLLALVYSTDVKFIKVLNKTHFECDENKILKMSAFNDDYCDCNDGSDENSKKLKK